MCSFTAELHVAGHVISLVRFRYDVRQSTGQRGRVNAKARRGPVECEADVPDHQVLESWAADPHQQQKAEIVVINDEGVGWETLTLPAA